MGVLYTTRYTRAGLVCSGYCRPHWSGRGFALIETGIDMSEPAPTVLSPTYQFLKSVTFGLGGIFYEPLMHNQFMEMVESEQVLENTFGFLTCRRSRRDTACRVSTFECAHCENAACFLKVAWSEKHLKNIQPSCNLFEHGMSSFPIPGAFRNGKRK